MTRGFDRLTIIGILFVSICSPVAVSAFVRNPWKTTTGPLFVASSSPVEKPHPETTVIHDEVWGGTWSPGSDVTSSFLLYQPLHIIKKPNSKAWESLCPSIWKPKDSRDVTVFWNAAMEDPTQVAERLLQELFKKRQQRTKKEEEAYMMDYLVDSLTTYRDFCLDQLSLPPRTADKKDFLFKARIVATRGPSGTKCPQWHIDHVPGRWVQSFIGPGCEFLQNDNAGVRWTAINDLDDDDDKEYSVEDRNQALVDPSQANIGSAKETQAVLLIGNRWEEFSKQQAHSVVPPAVHKSPANIPIWQGRVLLTQDVMVDH